MFFSNLTWKPAPNEQNISRKHCTGQGQTGKYTPPLQVKSFPVKRYVSFSFSTQMFTVYPLFAKDHAPWNENLLKTEYKSCSISQDNHKTENPQRNSRYSSIIQLCPEMPHYIIIYCEFIPSEKEVFKILELRR